MPHRFETRQCSRSQHTPIEGPLCILSINCCSIPKSSRILAELATEKGRPPCCYFENEACATQSGPGLGLANGLGKATSFFCVQ